MNQKTLKALRKMVRFLTVGRPYAQYTEDTGKRKYIRAPESLTQLEIDALGDLYQKVKAAPKVFEVGEAVGMIQTASGTIKLDPKCDKAIYKHFKKQIKANPVLAQNVVSDRKNLSKVPPVTRG